MGTGTEQKITITASSNLSEEEIDKAVKGLKKYAAEDKAFKEKVDVKTMPENMVRQTEKALEDLGDKVSADEKAGVQAEIERLKEALKTDDTEKIKNTTEELSKKFYEISQKLYQQAQAAQAAQGGADAGAQQGGQSDDGTVDAGLPLTTKTNN